MRDSYLIVVAAVSVAVLFGLPALKPRSDSAGFQNLGRFYHNDHWYLERSHGQSVDKPFIHDPDCPCGKH